MNVVLQIPESIISAIKIPEKDIEQELKNILAINLYSKGYLSFGKARQLTGLSKYNFGVLLTSKNIPRNYTEEELNQDLIYAN
jgi:predicted HTH domain antitoxin